MGFKGALGRLPAIITCCSVVGCATTDVVRLEATRRPPTGRSAIQVFVDEPTRPYKAIAVVHVDGLSPKELRARLVAAAAAEGGDAVIMGTQGRESADAVFTPVGCPPAAWVMVEDGRRMLTGKVVVFTDR